jgi:hypothetical protein
MSRRIRSDSVAAQVEVARRSRQSISPPSNVPLDAASLTFFSSVLSEFARSEWTAHQLELAAMLAREMSGMERNQRLLAEEGEVMATERGTPVVNPRKAVVQMHASSILAMRRSLSLNARAQGAKPSEVASRRQAARGVEAAIAEDGDGLLN